MGWEPLDALPDVVLVPIGGGGLLAGVGLALKARGVRIEQGDGPAKVAIVSGGNIDLTTLAALTQECGPGAATGPLADRRSGERSRT